MAILLYPNPGLEQKGQIVTQFDDQLGHLLDEMTSIMKAQRGIGLAANQIGRSERAIIIQTSKGDIYEMINPEIVDIKGEAHMVEGCLSAPTVFLAITRPAAILVQYQTRTGEIKKIIAEDMEARCIQHEVDHLNGIFFFSKVNGKQRQIAKSKLRKALK